MKSSKLIITSFLISTALISCGDGGAKRTDDPFNEATFEGKIIARSSVVSVNAPASNQQANLWNQQRIANNSNYQNGLFSNSNNNEVLYGLSDEVEFVKVPSDLQITEDNIDSIFASYEHVQLVDNILSSSSFGFLTEEDASNTNQYGFGSLPYGVQAQGGIVNYPNAPYRVEEEWTKINTTTYLVPVPIQYVLPSCQFISPFSGRVSGMNQRFSTQYRSRTQVRPGSYMNLYTSNFGNFNNFNNGYNSNNYNQINTTSTSEDNSQEYYLDNNNLYPYSIDDQNVVADDSLLLSDDSSCSDNEGCLWFSKLDNFANRFVTDTNIYKLWDHTVISFRSNACSSIDCTIPVTNEQVLIKGTYSYAVYGTQN